MIRPQGIKKYKQDKYTITIRIYKLHYKQGIERYKDKINLTIVRLPKVYVHFSRQEVPLPPWNTLNLLINQLREEDLQEI